MREHLTSKLLWIAFFLIVLFAIDRIGAGLLERVLLQSNFRYSKLYGSHLSNSSIIIGNSRSVNSFYTPEINKRLNTNYINLGFNGLPPIIEEALINDFYQFNGFPTQIILEISNVFDGDNDIGWGKFLKPFDQYSERLSSFLEKTDREAHLICKFSKLYCFNSNLVFRILYYVVKDDQNWINEGRLSKQTIASLKETYDVKCSNENVESVKRIVLKATSNNIPISLVLGPYFPEYRKRIPIENCLEKIERETGLTIWDYSDSIETPNMFADLVHLNKKGSIVLFEIMRQDGFFH